MKKSDLQYGNVVEFKNGRKAIVSVWFQNYQEKKENKFLLVDLSQGTIIGTGVEMANDLRFSVNHFMIIKVYKDYTCKELIWERSKEDENPTLTTEEIKVLVSLEILGFTYIARGEDEGLCAYERKPLKEPHVFNSWTTNNIHEHWMYLPNQELFKFILSGDEEPYKIGDLKNAQLSQ